MDRLLRALRPACLAAAVSCNESDSPRADAPPQLNVLILSIDTLRADHVGCYGYAPYPEPVSPAIDQFAREGVVFERCFVPRGQTGPSLSSMLTGCYPSTHGVLDNFQVLRPDVATLAQRLGTAGHATHAFLAFLPIAKASRAALGFEREDPAKGSYFEAKPRQPDGPQSAWDDAAEQRLVSFLRGRPRGAPPFFAWAHFYDVHAPYRAPLPFGEQFIGDYRGLLRMPPGADEATFERIVRPTLNAHMVARAPLPEADARYVVALYDGGVRATDERVGRILRALEDAGLAGETIVVLTADHGEELGEHQHFWFHGNSVYDSVLRVPLIVRGPGVAAGRSHALVQNVDLVPTILELVGARPAEGIDGVSFRAQLAGAGGDAGAGGAGERVGAEARRVAWSEWQHLILGARTERWKYLFNPRGARPKKPPLDGDDDPGYFVDCHELYEIADDAAERRNVWKARKDDEGFAELRAQVEEEFERRLLGLTPVGEEVIDDPAEIERLRRLGYVGAAGGRDYALDPRSCEDD